MFLAILEASRSSPNTFIMDLSFRSLKLFNTSAAEKFDKPIDISIESFDLKEKPLLRLFNCIDDNPRSKTITSAN